MRIELAQLEFIHRTLRKMVLAVEAEYSADMDFVVTSLYRIGDPGVHGQLPLRGIDIRCRDDRLGLDIQNWTNENYIYDPSRPWMKCCMYHDVGLGKHLHFQVHPRTVKLSVARMREA